MGFLGWNGPEPDGSFMYGKCFRMSTPEFFFLRRANMLPFAQAAEIGMELCAKYRTKLTCPSIGDGYDFLFEPRTTKKKIRHYLSQIEDTKEGKKALDVLSAVEDNSCTPMATFLYLSFSLPVEHGGMGMDAPHVSAVYVDDEPSSDFSRLSPSSYGDMLAYDVCWPENGVAVSYVGDSPLSTDSVVALITEKIPHVYLLADDVLSDMGAFQNFANDVANGMSHGHYVIHHGLEIPRFDGMMMTAENMRSHLAD